MGIIPLDNPTLPTSSSVACTTARLWTSPPSLSCGGAELHVVLSMRTRTKAAASLMFTLAGRCCGVVILHAVFLRSLQEQGGLAGQRAQHVHPAVPPAQQVDPAGAALLQRPHHAHSLTHSVTQSVSRWRCGLQLLVAGSSLLRAESQLHTFTSVKATALTCARVSLLSLDL